MARRPGTRPQGTPSPKPRHRATGDLRLVAAGRTATVRDPGPTAAPLPLADAIARHAPQILQTWAANATALARPGHPLDPQALRYSGASVLAGILQAMATAVPSHSADTAAASGHAPGAPTPVESHADAHRAAGFTLQDSLAEYAALRSSVLLTCAAGGAVRVDEVLAFDAAIDNAMLRCAARYEMLTKAANDLFLGIIGHDIRNPLGSILNHTELSLLTGQATNERAMPVINAARRIQAIVDQIVDFTRLQSFGSLPLHRRVGDLAAWLGKVVEETRLRQADATIGFEAQGKLWGSWDAGRLAQVLSNLLANAISYGARGRPIAVRAWEGAGQACFSVHNAGAAIPPDEAGRMFEPLVRGTGSERRAGAGLGLGLYICREIVRAHGGSLSARSTHDDGTTFTVQLPVLQPLPGDGDHG